MEILGQAAPGRSTGEAMNLMEELASKLPAGIGYDWTGMSYQERLSGNQAPALYAISLIVVFLCLAALYESWSIPFSVMLVVPLGGYRCAAGRNVPWADQRRVLPGRPAGQPLACRRRTRYLSSNSPKI
ncbi:hydrophobe/amphiphile efflux-1 (HAE1) family protein [Enterobacter cloacae]|uniref:Hydrophobe/amphiphile efflux-1 (HAE1) family protein n=1 Tax=Enterobacter cloacae TaxID=550 RepID=A0A377M708_ENTCL|nr:hydrophobe/amphiphile efflux-1 (HAE1) family protein [Enterobacter cloacae]